MLTNQLRRIECPVGEVFQAPLRVTFGYQSQRSAFSVWYQEDDEKDRFDYIILGAGDYAGDATLVASCVMPDGFHVFHLCQINGTRRPQTLVRDQSKESK